ncbi:MAG TPA: thiamine phosphate synthase [Burkholderiales bacterium]|nr:thiamine phosphate synthase [Burkholderiales bacterium]
MKKARISGLYAVTPDLADTRRLAALVRAALEGGCRWVQYRGKAADAVRRREQARELRRLTTQWGARLIVNDDVALALEVGADGAHVGQDDLPAAQARQMLGPDGILGVSCHNRLELAAQAELAGADYVAFGSFHPSGVKPLAVRADPALLTGARERIGLPRVAIGGITPENAPVLIAAGADAVAVVSALFGAPDVREAAQRFCHLFPVTCKTEE